MQVQLFTFAGPESDPEPVVETDTRCDNDDGWANSVFNKGRGQKYFCMVVLCYHYALVRFPLAIMDSST